MQKITPHLWFAHQAEEAVHFYTSVFDGGKIRSVTHYTEAGYEIHGMDAGTVLTINFEIEGFNFVALNGGPVFRFTPALSFMVYCETKERVDELYGKLSEGGTALMPLNTYPFSERYGWIQDRFGLSWQIIMSDQNPKQKIIPSLLFVGDVYGKAEEAISFYTSIFEDSKVGDINRYGTGFEPDKEDAVAFADFTLEGQIFAAMDSAREHNVTFNEAVSFMLTCKTQDEIDYYWKKLSAVKEAEQCGWLKDKYGISWQVVPSGMEEVLNGKDKEKARRTMDAMFKMKKIDLEALKNA